MIPTIGVSFTNNTDSIVTKLTISFTGEQWRLGTTGRFDRLDFQYSLDATSLSSGSWIDENDLDFIAPNFRNSRCLDRNLSANKTLQSRVCQ